MATNRSMDPTPARSSRLARLTDLDDLKVSDHDVDPRGWDLVGSDGTKLGEVKNLVADPDAMRVRYLEVEFDRRVKVATDEHRHALIPIGAARLDDDNDRVLVSDANLIMSGDYPTYGAGTTISRDYENRVRTRHDRTFKDNERVDEGAYYSNDFYDESRFRRRNAAAATTPKRTATTERDKERMTLSEEELAVGKRETAAGMVEVHKHVDTKHVKKTVPVEHEEVTVERRPISGNASMKPTIEEDEIRVPVSREEVVVEKRARPVEEVVVKKHKEVEQKTVEADLRRERVDVDDSTRKADADRDRRV